jgi:hypothetical protein
MPVVPATTSKNIDMPQLEPFDPESEGFDYDTAIEAGDIPVGGHWGSLDPRTGMVLKGRQHETWNLMEEEERRRGNRIIKKKDGRYYSEPPKGRPLVDDAMPDPPPFDFDKWIREDAEEFPSEVFSAGEKSKAISKAIYPYVRPFLANAYGTAEALNRGLASAYAHLDSIADYIEISTGMKKGKLFDNLVKTSEENAEYWKERADKVGMTFIDEIFSEAAGGFIPGVTTFALDVASGLTFPYMDGAARAYKKGEDPFTAGMLEAVRTGSLAALFRVIHPLKQYLRAPIFAGVFGLQEAEVAPEGEKTKAFVKGAAIGAGYSMTSPGGRLGLNEVREAMRPATKKFIEDMKKEEGAVGDIEKLRKVPPSHEIAQKQKAKYSELYEIVVGKYEGNLERVYETHPWLERSREAVQAMYWTDEAAKMAADPALLDSMIKTSTGKRKAALLELERFKAELFEIPEKAPAKHGYTTEGFDAGRPRDYDWKAIKLPHKKQTISDPRKATRNK